MALVIEDGTLTYSTANTYATLDYVTTYCANLGLSEWADAATDDLREQAILRAMAYIESKNYKGVKAEADDPLKWPREGVYDEDGYAIENDAIPDNLKRALARAAYEEVKEAGALQPSLEKGVKREKVDVIETEYFQSATAPQTVFPAIDMYLKGLIRSQYMVDLVRV